MGISGTKRLEDQCLISQLEVEDVVQYRCWMGRCMNEDRLVVDRLMLWAVLFLLVDLMVRFVLY